MIFCDEKRFKLPVKEHNSALVYSTSSSRSQNRVGPGSHYDQIRENIRCGWTSKSDFSSSIYSHHQRNNKPNNNSNNYIPNRLNYSNYSICDIRDDVLIHHGKSLIREIKRNPGPGQYSPQLDYWNRKSFNSRITRPGSSN